MASEKSQPIRILLIEDNRDDAALVRESLRQAGGDPFTLEVAVRLDEGIARLAAAPFDVVLLDLNLPDASGIGTFIELRSRASDLPVVVLSGNSSDGVALQAIQLGAQDYLIKGPAVGEWLPRVLKQAIARHRLSSQLQASEHKLRLLAEQLPAVLWTTDSELRLTSWSGRDVDFLRLPPDEVAGRSVCELFGAESGGSMAVDLHRRAIGGEAVTGDLRWAKRWYHAHVEPLRDARGDIVGTIGVALDFTREHKLKKDVEAAHRVQQHLLPESRPLLAGFDIAGACVPAEDCSGDFFDYIPLPNHRLAVVLADVSGHGFGPAIMASAVRSYLRTAAVLGNHVHEMLALSNRLLAHDAKAGPFATVFSVRLDAGSRNMQYASAGHAAYLLRKDGATEKLESRCVPIGVSEDEVFPLSRPIYLHRGDLLLLASDGLFETRRGEDELFGVERAIAVVRSEADRSAEEIVAALRRAACEFSGGRQPEDDLTMVVVKRCSAPPARLPAGDGSPRQS